MYISCHTNINLLYEPQNICRVVYEYFCGIRIKFLGHPFQYLAEGGCLDNTVKVSHHPSFLIVGFVVNYDKLKGSLDNIFSLFGLLCSVIQLIFRLCSNHFTLSRTTNLLV